MSTNGIAEESAKNPNSSARFVPARFDLRPEFHGRFMGATSDPPDPENESPAATAIANRAKSSVLGGTGEKYRRQPRSASLRSLMAQAHSVSLAYQFDGEAPAELAALIQVLDDIEAPFADCERDLDLNESDGDCDRESDGDDGERDDEDGACWGAHVEDQRDVCRFIGIDPGEPAREPRLVRVHQVGELADGIKLMAAVPEGGAK
jgi:hypothetical protein